MIRIAAAAALVTCAFGVVPTLAAEPIVSKSVSYADLDLSHSVAVQVLNYRVKAAIRSVCGDPDLHDLEAMSSTRKCRAAAMTDTARQIAAAADSAQRRASRSTVTEIASR